MLCGHAMKINKFLNKFVTEISTFYYTTFTLLCPCFCLLFIGKCFKVCVRFRLRNIVKCNKMCLADGLSMHAGETNPTAKSRNISYLIQFSAMLIFVLGKGISHSTQKLE